MRDYITLRALQKAATRTAELHGLKRARPDDIARMYNSATRYAQPVITGCERGILWVDKLYVAYQIDDGDVHYTYLTRLHIAEEVASYNAASREREKKIIMPADIRKCFIEAKRIMHENDMNYWVNEELMEENAG